MGCICALACVYVCAPGACVHVRARAVPCASWLDQLWGVYALSRAYTCVRLVRVCMCVHVRFLVRLVRVCMCVHVRFLVRHIVS